MHHSSPPTLLLHPTTPSSSSSTASHNPALCLCFPSTSLSSHIQKLISSSSHTKNPQLQILIYLSPGAVTIVPLSKRDGMGMMLQHSKCFTIFTLGLSYTHAVLLTRVKSRRLTPFPWSVDRFAFIYFCCVTLNIMINNFHACVLNVKVHHNSQKVQNLCQRRCQVSALNNNFLKKLTGEKTQTEQKPGYHSSTMTEKDVN